MEITPHTKVGALLDAHPELEDKLIAAVPAFAKLRNPILRATVAKVATLEQAARVGGILLPGLITLLRRELGQADGPVEVAAPSPVGNSWPAWYREEAVVERLEASLILAEGGHPLARVKQALNAHPPGAIVLLTSDFEPAPLLAQVGQEGMLAACILDTTQYRTAMRRD